MGAQRDPVLGCEPAHPLQVLESERDRLDEDVDGGSVLKRLRRERLDLVHPRVGAVAVRDRVREQGGPGGALLDLRIQSLGEHECTQLSLPAEAVARFALERGRPMAEHLGGQRASLPQHLRVGGLPQRPC